MYIEPTTQSKPNNNNKHIQEMVNTTYHNLRTVNFSRAADIQSTSITIEQ